MARGRMLSKSFSTSKKRARLIEVAPDLAEWAEALFMLLLAHADDFGRQPGDLFDVQLVVDPLSRRSEAELARVVELLVEVGLIDRYTATVGARAYNVIQINDFDEHQSGLHKRTTSKFPDRSGNFRGVPSQLNLTELKGTEQKGTSTRAHARAAHDPHPRTAAENVKAITRLVLSDVLPLGLSDADLPEVTKARCAALGIAYDSGSVHLAIETALRARHA